MSKYLLQNLTSVTTCSGGVFFKASTASLLLPLSYYLGVPVKQQAGVFKVSVIMIFIKARITRNSRILIYSFRVARVIRALQTR